MQTVVWQGVEEAILHYPECLEVPLVTKRHGTNRGCTPSERNQFFSQIHTVRCIRYNYVVPIKRKRRKKKSQFKNSGEKQQMEHFLQVSKYIHVQLSVN